MTDTLPPLVEPGPELTAEQIDRYRRQITLAHIGTTGQRRLRAARVLIIGAGGLGTPALQYLAGAGVGALGIVDDDVVGLSNLHRQVIHSAEQIGRPKVDTAAEAVTALNPEVEVHRHRVRLDAGNVVELMRGYDLVVDGSDNFATRYLVADASEITGVPVVWGAILRGSGQASVFWPGRGPHYRDVFPEPPAPGEVPSCTEAGVLGTLPGLLGTLMASQALLLITGTGQPLVGTMLLLDEATATTRTLRIAPDPEREPATEIAAPAEEEACEIGGPSAEETVDAEQLQRLIDAGVQLVDVREDWEHAAGSLPGALHIPLDQVLEGGADALPAGAVGEETVLFCQGGVRSARALEHLRADWAGREGRLRHLEGGYAAWVRWAERAAAEV